MNSFRLSIIALSVALIFSTGSSSPATTDYSHPRFTVADDHTLSLRETGSRIVMQTIEDVVRQGGLALFDENFQIESSLNWVFGERIEGEVDVVVPLWREAGENGYTGVVFAQPGLALWTGMADEDRIDTNLGVVYRTNFFNILTGIDVISGISVFYDNNFKLGHSRISLGVDAQHKGFHGGVNYYQPVSDEVEGRAGYIEDAVRGIDARLEFQRDIMRVSGNLGLWRYDGMGKSDWKSSYSLDAGVEISKGIFIEGGYEKHDDDKSIGDRLSLGVAFKYSLPGFKGRSYEDGPMYSNLYQVVERERRILYQEREAVTGPSVSVVLGEGESVDAIEEGGAITVTIRLDETFEENVTLNLIGTGTATYNDDYTVSVDGMDCTGITEEDNCSLTIMAGQVSASVVVTINFDGRGESAETIILSTAIADGGNTGLISGNALVLTIPEDPPFPVVSIVRTGSETIPADEEVTIAVDIQLSEMLEEDVTINLVGSGSATYNDDYTVSVGGTDCPMVTENNCPVTITAGQTSRSDDVEITVIDDGRTSELDEDVILSTMVASASNTGLMARGSLTLTIPADPPLPSVSLSVDNTSIAEGESATLTITLSEEVDEDVAVNLLEGGVAGDADYGTDMDWHLNNSSDCSTATGTSCQITVTAGQRTATATVNVNNDTSHEISPETFSVSVAVASTSTSIVQVGSTSSLTFTIPADPPLPTVSLISTSADMDIAEGKTATITLTLSEDLGSNATFNLISGGTQATYGTSDDWNLSVGGTDCNTASRGNPCQVTILQGVASANVTVEVNTDMAAELREPFTVSVEVDSGSTHLVQEGSPSMLAFNIQATQHTVSFRDSTSTATEGDLIAATVIIITPQPIEPVNIPLTVTGDDDDAYAFYINRNDLETVIPYENNMFVFPANEPSVTLFVTAPDDDNNINETVMVTLGSTLPDNYTAGTNSTWTVTIDDDE